MWSESVLVWRLRTFLERVVHSFWLVPALITVGAVALFVLTRYIDQKVAGIPVISSGGPDAARTLLSVIAGSLITVISVVFSITILIFQLTASNYSPRLLPRNFIDDRGAQVVFGMFVGTFAYCVLVLRILRTTGSGGGVFTPVVSVAVVVLLALVCVGLLIYFIAHVTVLIQASSIVQSARNTTLKAVSNLPDRGGEHRKESNLEEHPSPAGISEEEPLVLKAKRSGYIQLLNLEALTKTLAGSAAEGQKSVEVEIPYGTGYLIPAGVPIARIHPSPRIRPGSEKKLHRAFVLDKERSFNQDFAFGLRQLSDISLKGLSPAVNDPTTTMQAMDSMEAIFVALGKKEMIPSIQEREYGGVRVLFRIGYYSFDDVVGLAFDQSRRAAFTSGQIAVLDRLLEIIGRAIEENDAPERQKALWERALAVARQAPSQVPDPHDAVNLMQHAVGVAKPMMGTELAPRIREDLERILHISEGLPGSESLREKLREARGS